MCEATAEMHMSTNDRGVQAGSSASFAPAAFHALLSCLGAGLMSGLIFR